MKVLEADKSQQDVRLAAVMRAMGHPTRLRILERISEGEFCVSELEQALSVRQANVSQHLAILRDRGLVRAVRNGKTTCYYLTDPRIAEAIALVRRVLG